MPGFNRAVMLVCVLLVGRCAATAQEPDVYAIKGYLDSGPLQFEENLAKAEKLCREGLQSNVGDLQLTMLLVEALKGLGQYAEIPEVLTPAIALHPRNTTLISERAYSYFSMDRLDQALSDCRRLRQLGEPQGMVLAAEIFEKRDQPFYGIWCYTRLLEVLPDDHRRADWHFARAKHFTQFHMYDWAQYDVQQSLKAEWEPLKALLLGEVFARQQQWEEAEAVLQTVFDRIDDEQHHIAERRRLHVLLDMGELDKVTFLLQQYDEKYSGTDKLALADGIREKLKARLANIEIQKQAAAKQNRPSGFETAEISAAEREQMKTLKGSSKPEDLAELKRLMIRHAQFGMESEEPEYAKLMLKLLDEGQQKFGITDAEAARIATVEAWLLIQEDDYTSALEKANLATRKDPTFGDAWRMKGLAEYMTDDNAMAIISVSKAVELDPSNPMAFGLRALICTDQNQTLEAAQDLQAAGELAPNNRWLAGVRAHFFKAVEEPDSLLRNQCLANPGNNLERCELLLKVGYPKLVIEDIQEYYPNADESQKPRMAALLANAMYRLFTQTLQYEAGGPSAEQVVQACMRARELNPEDHSFARFVADVYQFDGQFSEATKWTEKSLEDSPDSAALLYQLASLHLLEGQLSAAKAASERMQQAGYDDDRSVGLRNEMESIVRLAEDLTDTLEQIKFRKDTSSALQQLLATPADTARVFSNDYAMKLDDFYSRLKPEVANFPAPEPDTFLQLSCISTADLNTQDHTLFAFDEDLASIAPRLQDGQFWLTAKYRVRGESVGRTYAYFVKLEDGWKIFPMPWLAQ